MATYSVEMTKKKETKNTVVYEAQEGTYGTPLITSLYVTKGYMPKDVEKITVTISTPPSLTEVK